MENEKKNDLMKENKELLNTPEGRFIKNVMNRQRR